MPNNLSSFAYVINGNLKIPQVLLEAEKDIVHQNFFPF